MNRQIDVFAADGSLMTPTFPKRAKQLVKTGRAKWIGDDSIFMHTVEKKEESILVGNNGQEQADVSEIEITEIPDDKIYSMAKKRVQERKGLIIHLIAYFSVLIFLLFISISASIYVAGGWGIGVACHVGSYFFSATPDAIQKEYLKMKNKYTL